MMMIRISSANFIGRLPCKNIKKNLGSNLRPGCGVDPTNRQKKIEKTKQTMTRVIPALIVDYHNSMVNNEYFFLSGVYGSSLTELEPSWHRVVEKEFMFQRLSNRNWAPKKTWIQAFFGGILCIYIYYIYHIYIYIYIYIYIWVYIYIYLYT